MKSREVQLIRRPTGMPKTDDFDIVEVELPNLEDGEVLVKNVSHTCRQSSKLLNGLRHGLPPKTTFSIA